MILFNFYRLFIADKRMGSCTRSKSKTTSEMAAADNSNKLDRVLANMEILLKANDQTELQLRNNLLKLEALESSQKKKNSRRNKRLKVKESYNYLEGKINEVESKVDEKVSRADRRSVENVRPIHVYTKVWIYQLS